MEPEAAVDPGPSVRLEDSSQRVAELESEVGEFITRHVLEKDATFFDG
jgi:hypothetical protein